MAISILNKMTIKGKLSMGASIGDTPFVGESKFSSVGNIQYDNFGTSSSISSDGNTSIVGAYADNTVSANSGTAYSFIRTPGATGDLAWQQIHQFQPDDVQVGTFVRFGWAVGISADGNNAIISAIGDDSAGTDAGAAYIFTRSGNTWTQQQKIVAGDPQTSARFGISVNMSANGDTVIVGSDYAEGGEGAAYIFNRSGSVWTQQQKIVASDATASDFFAQAVSISDNGDDVVVGATGPTSGASSNPGSAYIFTRTASNTTPGAWTQQQKITDSTGEVSAQFGTSVSMSSSGNDVVVGSTRKNNYTGSAAVFVRSGNTWSQQQNLTASDGIPNDEFGYSAGISGDGSTVVVGSEYYPDGDQTGKMYIFKRTGVAWAETEAIQYSGINSEDGFSSSVAMSSDGSTAIAGAPSYGLGFGYAVTYTK